jgi:tRNA (guanine-N7-)-methyltransferase
MASELRPERTPRLHVGGKLSFRRRVRTAPPGDPAALPLAFGGDDPPGLEELVPPGFADVELEVGPGKGAFLLAASEARPGTFVLGIEAAAAYAQIAADRVQRAGRRNALLLVDNAKLYLADRVPAGALARVHVYYPDPWPKRRHRGRRFFTDDVVPVLHRALAPDGWLLVATDNAAYAGELCRVLGASGRFRREPEEEQRLLALGPGHGFLPTNFERKYREEGRVSRRYAWRRLPVDSA